MIGDWTRTIHIQRLQVLDAGLQQESPYEREKLIEHINKTNYIVDLALQKVQEAVNSAQQAQMSAEQNDPEKKEEAKAKDKEQGQTAQQGAIQPEKLTGPSSPSPGGLGRMT